MLYCSYCNREASTKNSNSQHELYCKSNPNKKKKTSSFGMLGKKGLGIGKNQWSNPDYVIKDSTRKKLSDMMKVISPQRWSDPTRINKLKQSMRKAVERNPESYTSSNRGRTKQILYDGIKFQGSWELKFYQWCKNNGVRCNRNVEGFEYEWNGIRMYYPDFYLPKYQVYIEVKGYRTERDNAKWSQFPKQLIIVEKKDIVNIIRNQYTLPL
jgi:hypothetical protein